MQYTCLRDTARNKFTLDTRDYQLNRLMMTRRGCVKWCFKLQMPWK